ncbi:unnamed protein product [Durusdinium trenchii]|uniref:BTB/POZ domain-containing protein KCTD6 n=2 Tax=Durusdinium trenchii TaxID=1381693 RepID=A0ABP0IF38_9DINO
MESCGPTDTGAEAVVRLNVGGHQYTTAVSTLTGTDGMLARMFNGTYSSTKIDGAYFIDRDGQLFRYVLEFLRNQTVQLPDSISVLRQIQQEAEFFAIAGLLAAVKQKLLERRVRVEIHVERFRCSDDGCNCGAGQKVEVSALEGLAFFDCELFHPRRELRPNWTTPSASLLVTLHPEESLEPAIEAVHHAILCADEVCEQSAKEIVLEEGSPVRRALGDLAATPEMCYLQWYARANEYKVGDTRDPSLQYVHYAKCVKLTFEVQLVGSPPTVSV